MRAYDLSINYMANERKSHLDIPQIGALVRERMEIEKRKRGVYQMQEPTSAITSGGGVPLSKSRSQPVMH